MKRVLAFSILILIAACAPAQGLQTSEVLETSEVSPATAIAEVTVTPMHPSTPTPKATTTPEPTSIPEVKMTLEDWKKIFDGPYISNDGTPSNLSTLFTKEYNVTLTARDIDTIEGFNKGRPMMILHKNGNITAIADIDQAIEQAKKGAIIIASNIDTNASAAAFVRYAIMAASHAWRDGNKHIHVSFGEITSMDYQYPDRKLIDIQKSIYLDYSSGYAQTPIMDIPPYFTIGNEQMDETNYLTPEEAGITLDETWLDQILKAGYTRLLIACQAIN